MISSTALSPTIRPAAASDDEALLALHRTSWTAGSGFPSARSEEMSTYFTGRRKPETHLVAEQDGAIVGYVSVEPKLPFTEAAHVYALWSLVVSAQARRLGIASALLAAAEQVALERGATKLSLRVLGSNLPAQRLYERHGYVLEGRHAAEFLIDGEYVDDLALAKSLRQASDQASGPVAG
ncbi:GNAT family N-acetyltransferase [Micromonospora parathelypteridis]|uniref:Ribosomal protein S18 acetylase RimI-like enzyme n=1 Tax=Micromonospora parathelypteridis TaxID=1839617 RepID=A0A840W9V5_9ACTN|nr:GNAT family N-acetyltransferase [Micromonospora parathelypteridis]MBB5479801.1 ribosomal protein S18 acetylase RimI-like enzyme [Micromonospora parathelypteridis]GGO31585.1 N-acetyltransferase [Micromonospora parathelypteridis]